MVKIYGIFFNYHIRLTQWVINFNIRMFLKIKFAIKIEKKIDFADNQPNVVKNLKLFCKNTSGISLGIITR